MLPQVGEIWVVRVLFAEEFADKERDVYSDYVDQFGSRPASCVVSSHGRSGKYTQYVYRRVDRQEGVSASVSYWKLHGVVYLDPHNLFHGGTLTPIPLQEARAILSGRKFVKSSAPACPECKKQGYV